MSIKIHWRAGGVPSTAKLLGRRVTLITGSGATIMGTLEKGFLFSGYHVGGIYFKKRDIKTVMPTTKGTLRITLRGKA